MVVDMWQVAAMLMCFVILQKKYTVHSIVQVYLTSQVRMPGKHSGICWISGSREPGGRQRQKYRRKHQENESHRGWEKGDPLRGERAMGRWRRRAQPPKGSLDLAMPKAVSMEQWNRSQSTLSNRESWGPWVSTPLVTFGNETRERVLEVGVALKWGLWTTGMCVK